jgi:hypothetical protein
MSSAQFTSADVTDVLGFTICKANKYDLGKGIFLYTFTDIQINEVFRNLRNFGRTFKNVSISARKGISRTVKIGTAAAAGAIGIVGMILLINSIGEDGIKGLCQLLSSAGDGIIVLGESIIPLIQGIVDILVPIWNFFKNIHIDFSIIREVLETVRSQIPSIRIDIHPINITNSWKSFVEAISRLHNYLQLRRNHRVDIDTGNRSIGRNERRLISDISKMILGRIERFMFMLEEWKKRNHQYINPDTQEIDVVKLQNNLTPKNTKEIQMSIFSSSSAIRAWWLSTGYVFLEKLANKLSSRTILGAKLPIIPVNPISTQGKLEYESTCKDAVENAIKDTTFTYSGFYSKTDGRSKQYDFLKGGKGVFFIVKDNTVLEYYIEDTQNPACGKSNVFCIPKDREINKLIQHVKAFLNSAMNPSIPFPDIQEFDIVIDPKMFYTTYGMPHRFYFPLLDVVQMNKLFGQKTRWGSFTRRNSVVPLHGGKTRKSVVPYKRNHRKYRKT